MTRQPQRSVSRLSTALWVLLFFAVPAPLAAEPGDSARDALSQERFPWYDSEADDFRPVDPPRSVEIRSGGIPLAQLLMWILVGIVVALAVYFLIRWGIDYRSGEKLSSAESASTLEVDRLEALPESARQVRDLLGQARLLADQGRFNEAIVFLYGWQLVQLDRQGSIELQKGKTNHQYVDEVADARPEIEQVFTRSTRLFEDAYFGSLNIAESAFRSVWDHNHMFDAAGPRGGSR